MKRISPYSMIHVALPIHLTLPPRDPGMASPFIAGSLTGEPLKVDNLSEGRVSDLDMMKFKCLKSEW